MYLKLVCKYKTLFKKKLKLINNNVLLVGIGGKYTCEIRTMGEKCFKLETKLCEMNRV